MMTYFIVHFALVAAVVTTACCVHGYNLSWDAWNGDDDDDN